MTFFDLNFSFIIDGRTTNNLGEIFVKAFLNFHLVLDFSLLPVLLMKLKRIFRFLDHEIVR